MRLSALISKVLRLLARRVCLCGLLVALGPALALAQRNEGQTATDDSAFVPSTVTSNATLIYDTEYPFIDYSGTPIHNDIARLISRIDRGEVKLQYRPGRGYLESVLKALNISPTTQGLVFSKTSLQTTAIGPNSPRAIYFNDDTYVAWVQDTGVLEMSTMDSDRGPVFYTLTGNEGPKPHPQRQVLKCLACHDSSGEKGGGTPQFLFLSAYGLQDGQVTFDGVATMTKVSTPLLDRWGGWYVTGNDSGIRHLGNIQVTPNRQPVKLDEAYRGSVPSLTALFDTKPYLTDKSDIVALMVLQHQVTIHNRIIHANYKSRWMLERQTPGSSRAGLHWQQLSPSIQKRMARLLEPLVSGMLLTDAVPLEKSISSTSGFTEWFQSRGPRDKQGRSLRELDLKTHVFRYPMSFLIYSEGFDFLPTCVKEYVYGRFVDILQGKDQTARYSHISAADRLAVLQILEQTKPEFAQALKSPPIPSPSAHSESEVP